jgi:REP element-mobilizing transposase RayT
MARPLRIQYPGAVYHVTCRGNERRKIFLDDDDRRRFLTVLAESLAIYQVVLYGYVMMSNHFHIIVQTVRANLSEFMRRFNICYTGWFNYHHSVCGHLYQGRYKALLVDADRYLLELSRYVHLNPVRVGKFRRTDYRVQWQYLRDYRWSSLLGYVNEKWVVDFVDYDRVLDMVRGRRAYQRFVVEGLRDGVSDVFDDVQYQTILGDAAFVARVKDEYVEEGSLREQPVYREMVVPVIAPEVVLDCAAQTLAMRPRDLSDRMGNGIDRGIVAELLYRYCSITQREIGQLLGGIEYTAVSMLRSRLTAQMDIDTRVKKRYAKVERALQRYCEE